MYDVYSSMITVISLSHPDSEACAVNPRATVDFRNFIVLFWAETLAH